MTGWLFLAVVSAGVLCGEFWFRVRRADDRIDAILKGQSQAELAHGWHMPVDGTPVNVPHRRSPNEQFVTRQFSGVASILRDQAR